MRQRATVRELAAETGLSIATVSRVLNGQSNVAARTREVVLEAAGRLSPQTPRLRADLGAVTVRCPYLLDDYFGPMVSSVVETVELYGMTAVLNAGDAARRPGALTELAARPGIAGGILILPPEEGAELAQLRDQGFPFVVLDPRTPPPRDIVAVSAAHMAGARNVMGHLVELGHRRIGIVGGPRHWLVTHERMTGYTAALADAGVLPSADLLRNVSEPNVADGYRAACELLDRPDRPTALVGFNDKIAVGALRAARERGLRVPADLSVVGFDDTTISEATEPQLTTVRQPLAELGRMAVTMLVRMINRHDLDARHVELACDLVVRGSSAPAAK
ncbi:MAG: LacI family DNA-binding transcriptional regulator [Actinoplanes sp.]